MVGTTGTHTGLLVVRIWREQLSEDPLRIHARITSTVDVLAADDRVLGVDSTDQVTQAVREWLRRYLAHYPTTPVGKSGKFEARKKPHLAKAWGKDDDDTN